MHRRELLTGLTVSLMGIGHAAHANAPGRKVGILMPYPESDALLQSRVSEFKAALGHLGWIDGQTVDLHQRWTSDDLSRVRQAASELVQIGAEVILTTGSRVVPIVQKANAQAIVFVGITDPVGQGLVESISRPGRNTTGFSHIELQEGSSPYIGKLMELALELVPGLRRIALIFNPDNPAAKLHAVSFESLATRRGLKVLLSPVQAPQEIDKAISSIASAPASVAILPSDLTLLAQRDIIVQKMADHKLPAVYSDESFVAAGGLVSYSADRKDLFRRSAEYVDRILRGEKPGTLPIQFPLAYELTLNLKTAARLSLEIPPLVLARADTLIQ